jgi:multiple sugar transport system permease protein
VRERRRRKALRAVLLLAALAFFLFPIFWLLETSLKPSRNIFDTPPSWIFSPTLENYEIVFRNFAVLDFLRNSVIIAAGSTALSLLLGVPAAYAIARSQRTGLRRLAYVFLGIRMMPPIAMLLPWYLFMRDLHLLGTYQAVIAINTVLNSAFVVWMLYAVFRELPVEIEEAALTDGANRWSAFWRIALPLARPGLIAAALFCLLFAWNDFLFALLLTSPQTKTLPVALLATFSSQEIGWGQLAVLSQITVLPVVVAAIYLNRNLVAGLAGGAR